MKKQKFTIGTDPEFFLQSQETQEFVPASMFFLEHNKDNPKDFGGGFGVLRDNVMVEFNVPPASSKEEFISNLNKVSKILLIFEIDLNKEKQAHRFIFND